MPSSSSSWLGGLRRMDLPLPNEVLLLVLGQVQRECLSRYDHARRDVSYGALLACALVCKTWAAAVPVVLYRDVCVSLPSGGRGGASVANAVRGLVTTLRTLEKLHPQIPNIVTTLQVHLLYEPLDIQAEYPAAQRAAGDYESELLSLVPRLRSLTLVCHDLGTAPNPSHLPVPMPPALVATLRRLTSLKRVRIERAVRDWKYTYGSLASALLTHCPALTHFDIEPVDIAQVQLAPGDARGRRQLEHLSVAYHGDVDLAPLGPRCTHLRALFLSLNSGNLHDTSKMLPVFPPALETLGLYSIMPHLLSFPGVFAGIKWAFARSQRVCTVILQRDLLHANLIGELPRSVRTLGVDLRGATCVSGLGKAAAAIIGRAEQLEGVVVYVDWVGCAPGREERMQRKATSVQELCKAFKARGKSVRFRDRVSSLSLSLFVSRVL
ncbi:hypothetical protein BKA62DRAFT_257217 [Auriculariales sp. MPI-PUGE-AT-0066]|nr:hypothetical protein BKA62DRAFT_257217 [Auriculariales sp. MPI-PUGE-AT-0066]